MKKILTDLFHRHSLTREEAKGVFLQIAEGTYDPYQIAAFLAVYKMRNVEVDELLGFREALLELAVKIDLSEFEAIDLSGTGGDGKDTFNVSTLSAFVTAGAGIKVAKHGNYGVSSICGSSNVLEHLGYNFTNDESKLKKQLEATNICVLHAPLFHPALKEVGPIRKGFGLSSIFNLLGPMVNPSNPKNQLIGVFNLEVLRLYQYVYQNLEVGHTLVHSLDGYDEISLTGNTRIVKRDSEQVLAPEELGFERLKEEQLYGGSTIADAAKIFLSVLRSESTAAQKNIVVANASMAIQCSRQELSYEESRAFAQKSLESGAALESFENSVKMSQ